MMATFGKLYSSWRTHPEIAGAEPVDRATWVWLWLYSVEHEIGGRIAGARRWGDRRWQQCAQVTADEVATLVDRTDLARWEGDDLVVAYCDGQLDSRSLTSARNGAKGGRPRGRKPTQKPTVKPNQNLSAEPNRNLTTETDKRRQEKTRQEERGACAPPARAREQDPSPFVDNDGLTPGSDDPEAHWRMQVHAEPWARDLKRKGAKIGPGSWERWAELLRVYGETVLAEAIAATSPDRRFADDVETWIQRNRQSAGTGRGVIL